MANEFEKIFDKVSIGKNRQDIYVEWLDYMIDINLLSLTDQHLDFEGREKEYYKMFGAWAKIVGDKICRPDDSVESGLKGWYDYLGTFYQNNIQSGSTKSSTGAFYTPANVCQTMAEMTFELNKDYTDKLVNDSCCGSGRFILAGHSIAPNAIYIGMDLDLIAVKQTVLNMYIHGIRGSVLHMNSLSGEFYAGWKVNQYLSKGFIVPHIELIHSYDDAFYFYGKNKSNDEMIEISEDENINCSDNKYKPQGTGQTTLF